MFAWLKRPVPRGLYGRALLILVVPIATLQLVVSVVFIQRHFEAVTRQMTGNVVIEIAFIRDAVAGAADLAEARRRAGTIARALGMTAELPATPARGERRHFWDLSGREVIATLKDELPGVIDIDLLADHDTVNVGLTSRFGPIEVGINRSRVSASNPHQLLVLMIVTGALMTLIAYAFLRNQLRPITKLAAAAEAFGKGRVLPYRPRGALEVRAAGKAFLDMRARIERQIEQRTLMLSGVSHDLRTPLTRLKLGLAMAGDDAETVAMQRDVADMERLIDSFLAFARDGALDDPAPTDPVALVARTVENAQRAGQAVRLADKADGPNAAGPVILRPMAVARALENLVGNAVRYGTRADVSVAVTERSVRFSVEDDGPGIPPERREEALRPFTRLDAARNQNRGSGVGLGLSIAIDIARSHGGTLRLGTSASLGGLRADLVLAR